MKINIPNKFNEQIAFFRAFSVLAVLGYHFFPSYFSWGFLGVDWFFFISGYLMIPLIDRNKTLTTFIKNRFFRLYPALLLFLIFYILLGYFFLLDDEFLILLKSSLTSLTQVHNYFEFIKDGYFVNSTSFRPFLNVWSLSVEFQVYIIYAFLFFFLIKNSTERKKFASILLIAFISLSFYILSINLNLIDPFFISPMRLWEFLIGSFIYFLHRRHKNINVLGKSKYFLYLFLFVLLFTIIGLKGDYKVASTLFALLLCSLFVLYVDLSKLPCWFKASYLYVGSISYSIYLFHYPAIEFLARFFGSPSISNRLIVIVFIFIIAHLVDRYFFPNCLKYKKLTSVLFFVSFSIVVSSIYLIQNINHFERAIINKNSDIIRPENFNMNYNFNCKFFTKKNYNDERCRIGSKVNFELKPDFLVIGDSLSNSLTTMFEAMGDKNDRYQKYIQIGKGYCPVPFNFSTKECFEFSQEAKSYIKKLVGIPIIIAGQWPLYFNEEIKSLSRKKEFIKYIKDLKEKGHDVIIVQSVPLGAKPRTCIIRSPWLNVRNCNISLSTAKKRGDVARQIITDIANETDSKLFDPQLLMCDESQCSVLEKNSILYLDDSHLSEDGGKFLSEKSLTWWDNYF